MSASYFKLKILKKKQSKKIQQVKSETVHKNKTYQGNRCRICLNEGCIPIYNERVTFDLSEAVRTFGEVEVQENDMYPKHLCDACHSLLSGAILFRKSAKESDEILRQASISSVSCITEFRDTTLLNDDDFREDLETIRHKEENVYVHECKVCQIKFKTLQEYSRHKTIKKHFKVRIQCKICMKLLTQQLYKKHLARHQSATHLVCDVCGKLYRKDNLLRHLQLHSNELPFQCKVCPYRGRFMESLKIHMRTHTGDKPYSCDKCDLRFITRSNLNRHLLTHEKEKPFKCIECSRGFYIQRDLDIHLRADHAGIKEFCCKVCGNKYGTKKALMRHELRVHKRDKMAKGRMPLYLQAQFQNNQELVVG